MITETYDIEFITPCFCAGANQARAELRATAVRGELRWWFRARGGNPIDEKLIFGSVGNTEAMASNLVVRILSSPSGGETGWSANPLSMGHGGYLWFFIKAGNPKRWQSEGAIAPGSKCRIALLFRHTLSPTLQQQWQGTLESFLRFGGIGYRLTRCAGAIRCPSYAGTLDDYQHAGQQLLKPKGFDMQFPDGNFPTWRHLIESAEALLKNQLRAGVKAKNGPSPLGLDNPRQTSAVYLRPLKLGDKEFRLMVFEAPHARVLDPPLQQTTPILSTTPLSYAVATNAPPHRGGHPPSRR